MIGLDPYLHEWDERFHALVAKNMIENPFKPMLFIKHVMSFNPQDWGYLHIWVHKQPLFLWQMALSMKLFGVSTFAMRLPSAIMGVIMIWMTYQIGKNWTKDENIAFFAAFISTFSYYSLELISGWMCLEHNDLAFTFYVTGSIWAFTEYIKSEGKLKWAIWIGVFAGCGILNKWLVGLLIFGGWGLYLLQSFPKVKFKDFKHLAISVFICCLVFLPWQIYILMKFPVESANAFEYNRVHMVDALGHPGTAFFHFNYLSVLYQKPLLPFIPIGIFYVYRSKFTDRKLTVSFFAMIAVMYTFFSFLVTTKMPAFVYPVSVLMITFMSAGIYNASLALIDYSQINMRGKNALLIVLVLLTAFGSLKSWLISGERSKDNVARNNKIYNDKEFESINSKIIEDYVILNTRTYENIELMFFQGGIAYHFYPSESKIDSLQNLGYKFAAFNYENDLQELPNYITCDSSILILKNKLK